ncbi:MAG: hypothetical protein LBE30_11370 [Comamonas sp.]|jgi:hypothetical protein|nr:hypothetical protein [Comamonas sp.]
MKTGITLTLLAMALGGPLAHAQPSERALPGNASEHDIKLSLIETGATMSEQTLKCGLVSEKDVQATRALHRKSMPGHLGFSSAEYDSIYTRALTSFQQRWATMSTQQREQECQQLHMLNKDSH